MAGDAGSKPLPFELRFFAHETVLGDAKDAGMCWAKVRGYPWWLAQVMQTAEAEKRLGELPRKRPIAVMFFGTAEVSWVAETDVIDLAKGLKQGLLLKSKLKSFVKACAEAILFLALDRPREAPKLWWTPAPADRWDPNSTEPPALPFPVQSNDTEEPPKPSESSEGDGQASVAVGEEAAVAVGSDAPMPESASQPPAAQEATAEAAEACVTTAADPIAAADPADSKDQDTQPASDADGFAAPGPADPTQDPSPTPAAASDASPAPVTDAAAAGPPAAATDATPAAEAATGSASAATPAAAAPTPGTGAGSQKQKPHPVFLMAGMEEFLNKAPPVRKPPRQSAAAMAATAAGTAPPPFNRIHENHWQVKKLVEDIDSERCTCSPPGPGRAGCGDNCINRNLYYLCDPKTCPCGDRCSNIPFQLREKPKLEHFLTENRGWGVRSVNGIRAGEFVEEYVGEVIDEAKLQERMESARQLNEHNYYTMDLGRGLYIDARNKGNLSRFLNSSCDPNCVAEKWFDIAQRKYRVGIFARKEVLPMEELTYNYNYEKYDSRHKDSFICLCGAAKCRGTMDRNKSAAGVKPVVVKEAAKARDRASSSVAATAAAAPEGVPPPPAQGVQPEVPPAAAAAPPTDAAPLVEQTQQPGAALPPAPPLPDASSGEAQQQPTVPPPAAVPDAAGGGDAGGGAKEALDASGVVAAGEDAGTEQAGGDAMEGQEGPAAGVSKEDRTMDSSSHRYGTRRATAGPAKEPVEEVPKEPVPSPPKHQYSTRRSAACKKRQLDAVSSDSQDSGFASEPKAQRIEECSQADGEPEQSEGVQPVHQHSASAPPDLSRLPGHMDTTPPHDAAGEVQGVAGGQPHLGTPAMAAGALPGTGPLPAGVSMMINAFGQPVPCMMNGGAATHMAGQLPHPSLLSTMTPADTAAGSVPVAHAHLPAQYQQWRQMGLPLPQLPALGMSSMLPQQQMDPVVMQHAMQALQNSLMGPLGGADRPVLGQPSFPAFHPALAAAAAAAAVGQCAALAGQVPGLRGPCDSTSLGMHFPFGPAGNPYEQGALLNKQAFSSAAVDAAAYLACFGQNSSTVGACGLEPGAGGKLPCAAIPGATPSAHPAAPGPVLGTPVPGASPTAAKGAQGCPGDAAPASERPAGDAPAPGATKGEAAGVTPGPGPCTGLPTQLPSSAVAAAMAPRFPQIVGVTPPVASFQSQQHLGTFPGLSPYQSSIFSPKNISPFGLHNALGVPANPLSGPCPWPAQHPLHPLLYPHMSMMAGAGSNASGAQNSLLNSPDILPQLARHGNTALGLPEQGKAAGMGGMPMDKPAGAAAV